MTDRENDLLSQIHQEIVGDGTEQHPGYRLRMDRIERTLADYRARAARLDAWLMALFCGGGVAVIAFVYAIAQRSGH
ncbi:MAG TPA: hypothetical protein VHQ47_18020 [Phycisphaerae bacterium]|jgi:hypothetical protein|nr:hypothetical protein [Phycisphaerae bacterium]